MSKVSNTVNDIIGTINGLQTLVETWPDEQLNLKVVADWLSEGGQFTSTFDVLGLLLRILGKEDIESIILSKMETNLLTPSAILDMEGVVKNVLAVVLSSILDCSANPMITDDLISLKNGSEREDLGGVTIDMDKLDLTGKLFASPASPLGRLMYSDIVSPGKKYEMGDYDIEATESFREHPELWGKITDGDATEYYYVGDVNKIYGEWSGKTLTSTDEEDEALVYLYLKEEKSRVDLTNLWKTRDMDAWLWYVINKGQDSDKSIWDNRYNTRLESKAVNATQQNTPLYGIGAYNTEDFFEKEYYSPEWDRKVINEIKIEVEPNDITVISGVSQEAQKIKSNEWILQTSGIDKVISGITNNWLDIRANEKTKITLAVKDNPKYEAKSATYRTKTNDSSVSIDRNSVKSTFPYKNNTIKGTIDTSDKPIILLAKTISYTKKENAKENLLKDDSPMEERPRIALLKADYRPGTGNGAMTFHIPGENYYRARPLGEAQINKFMMEWNRDYLQSIKLYDFNTIIGGIVSRMRNMYTINVSLTRSQLIVNNIIEQVIGNVIKMDDMAVEDCYFSFSNDEYDSMLEKADLVRRGLSTSYEEVDVDKLISDVDDVTNATFHKDITGETSSTNVLAGIGGKDINGDTSLNVSATVDGLLKKYLQIICSPFIDPLLSPKVMVAIMMNLRAAGFDLDGDFNKTWNTIMSKIVNCVKEIVIEIKNYMVDMLYGLVEEMLTDLMNDVVVKVVMEQIEEYRSVLTHLYDLLTKILKNARMTSFNGMDVVNNADILEVSTDSENKQC